MIDSVGIIFLSYFVGCLSTVVVVLLGFIHYGRRIAEDQHHPAIEQEQFVKGHSWNENDRWKNSTIEMINYLLQFFFQELKDTAKLRRFILKKLLIEFDDIKRTQIGQLFLREISVRIQIHRVFPQDLIDTFVNSSKVFPQEKNVQYLQICIWNDKIVMIGN